MRYSCYYLFTYLFILITMQPSPDRHELIARLRALLKLQPINAAEICAHLQISQPTFSRLWPQAGPDLIRIGAARATRYAMLRTIRELDSLLPVFVVDKDGNSAPFGQLRLLQNDWYCFTPAGSAVPEWILGLPFWLQDLRPQGFLGRLIPAMHPDLMLPANILHWSDDDTLYFLARRGDDVPGNLIVGNEAYRRFLSAGRPVATGAVSAFASASAAPIARDARAQQYAVRAHQANLGDAPGSSAGGEQAKFTAQVWRDEGRLEHVIVKFSPPLDSAGGRRWADLLVAEHLALATLREAGIAACASDIVITPTRVFLEVVRFDRQAERGRAALVSMAGIDTLLGALDKNWSTSTRLLHEQGRLSQADWQCVCMLDVFGALIGNSDRHPGNLSLRWQVNGRFALAPVYDMLPMLYRPNAQGEVIARQFDPAVLDRLDLRCLPQALCMARLFWQWVLVDARISPDFKSLADAHQAAIAPL